MARGWESKDVESQMDSAEERRVRSQAVQANLKQIAITRERESIELSRTRVKTDIASAINPGYRAMLEQSLKFLDDKLAALERDAPKSQQ
jgi:molecular chaperone GrpE (heat shock protein)